MSGGRSLSARERLWTLIAIFGTWLLTVAVSRGAWQSEIDESEMEEEELRRQKAEREMHEDAFCSGYYKGRRDARETSR